jgi:hypothetical protein
MLPIMTVNAGYCLSVLGGTFLGSLVAVRYATREVTDQTLHAYGIGQGLRTIPPVLIVHESN